MLENIDRIIEFVTMLTTVLFVICRSNSNIKKKIEEQTSQLFPNGGNSLRDVVDRIDKRLVTLEATQRALLDLQEEDAGHFLADKCGSIFWVSDKFAAILELDKEECLGVEWLKGVAETHKLSVFSTWKLKVNTGEAAHIRFDNKAGLPITLNSVPVIDPQDEVIGFVGKIKP